MIVLDASALVDVLVDAPTRLSIEEHLRSADEVLAPELLLIEAASALWRLQRGDLLTEADASEGVSALQRFPVTLVSHDLLLDHAWQLRHSHRITDAFYVALAAHLRVPLLTTDYRLARGVAGVSVISIA
ncbi:type II toxin-antitoxin system VapC family toxin [Knoellia subterranea]|uniref:Ribonuclease VapC n=1 Tax=Knoellia subterranea KCTC 19937 TaxID=1385521 RepID=A0A0A0JN62_9MICO|nr:type II toxin-antitoxin system VapC family toxin [Knoellia subterranea]KGN38204.1 twitching motility protein PilT [Knoellia subterranea KCTC 19937]